MAIKEDTQAMINPPDGFDARNSLLNSALFSWNPEKTSVKLTLDEDCLICTSK